MHNIELVIANISKWVANESNTGGLAALRRGGSAADRVLAQAGASIPLKNGEAYLEAYSVVGFLLAHGIRHSPRKGGAFLKAFKTNSGEISPRVIMLTDSKHTKSACQVLRKSVGIFKGKGYPMDMVSIFWTIVKWEDKKSRRLNIARWFEDYYSSDKEAKDGTN